MFIRAGFLEEGTLKQDGAGDSVAKETLSRARSEGGQKARDGGRPPSKSACCRALHISCGLSWMPTLRRVAFMLRMSTDPVGPELNSLKISWNAAGGEGGRQHGGQHAGAGTSAHSSSQRD